MGTLLDSIAMVHGRRGPHPPLALKLADGAARDCLQRAGRKATEIDLLVNAGLYRDRGISEPALAALIQEDIGANLGDPPTGGHGTFSFDVDNGECGVLTAMHLAHGFLDSGSAELAMVVASDSDSGGPLRSKVPVPQAGGALLLRRDGASTGFTKFAFSTFPEFAGLYESYWEWQEGRRRGLLRRREGLNVLVVKEDPEFVARSVDCAATAVDRFLEDAGLAAGDVDLLIANRFPEFPEGLAERTGISKERLVGADEGLRNAHTAGVIAALDAAASSGRLAAARNALVVCAAAGITIGIALYRR